MQIVGFPMRRLKSNKLSFRPCLTVTNWPVQSQKQAGSLKFRIKVGFVLSVAKTKVLISCAVAKALLSCAVSAQLICAFVFAHADCWFSDAVVHFSIANQEDKSPIQGKSLVVNSYFSFVVIDILIAIIMLSLQSYHLK